MVGNNDVRRVAIACQGGGSHTAFTAGVLKKLLEEKGGEKHNYEVVALSGTSGGAICALLAWYGLLTNDTNKAVELLDSFWRDNSANSSWDRLLNGWFLWMSRFFANTGGVSILNPYFRPLGAGPAEEHDREARRFRENRRTREAVEPAVARWRR